MAVVGPETRDPETVGWDPVSQGWEVGRSESARSESRFGSYCLLRRLQGQGTELLLNGAISAVYVLRPKWHTFYALLTLLTRRWIFYIGFNEDEPDTRASEGLNYRLNARVGLAHFKVKITDPSRRYSTGHGT